jgi:hypothetical protein
MPTLPFFPSVGERRALLAGITFIEEAGSGSMSVQDLREWFDRYIVDPGVMPRPTMVSEPTAGSIPLYLRSASTVLSAQAVERVIAAARSRVVSSLRGLLASPSDDRFVAGALFSGRVQRRRGADGNRWVAHPEPSASLSGILLSLFAVDVLSNRDAYDQNLCVCDVCGRISFQDGPVSRRNCAEHPAHESGFIRAVLPRRLSGQR